MKTQLHPANLYQNIGYIILGILFLLGSLNRAICAETDPGLQELKAELEQTKLQFAEMQSMMLRRIEALQQKLAALEGGPGEAVGTSATPVVSTTKPQPAAPVSAAKPLPVPTTNPIVTSSYPVTLYGKAKFDGIYDTTSLGSDELIKFVPSSMPDGTKSRLSFTERETRIGMAVDGPDMGKWSTNARVETDFYGSAQSSGSGSLRIRRAYFETTDGTTTFKAGQDWLPVASMNPATLNFAIMGYSGNLWGRVPQVTISHDFSDEITGYITSFRFRRTDEIVPGLKTDLRWPWFGGKLQYKPDLFDSGNPATFGISGGYRSGCIEITDVNPYLLALEFSIPFSDQWSLLGEWYTGEGLGAEFYHKGGTFNGTGSAIQTEGGFVQLGYNPDNPFKFHVGYGYDDPKDGDVMNDFYQKNSSLFLNGYYTFMKNTSFGLEATEVQTKWYNGEQEGYRIHGSFIFVW